MGECPKYEKYEELRSFFKIILILRNKNDFSESRFSINKGLLIENLCEESLVSGEFMTLQYYGGVKNVIITKICYTLFKIRTIFLKKLEKKRNRNKTLSHQNEEKKRKILDKARPPFLLSSKVI